MNLTKNNRHINTTNSTYNLAICETHIVCTRTLTHQTKTLHKFQTNKIAGSPAIQQKHL